MSKYIHLIDYKKLIELEDHEKEKINRFIQCSNKINEIFLKNKICNDVIKHNINTMI